MGNNFRRNHEGDYHCQEAEVRRMFADAEQTPADHRILEGFSLADLDTSTLAQYRQRFQTAKRDHAWLAFGDQELLEKLGGWRRDRQSGREGITLAGLLMFGKDQAIRDVHAAPEYFVDYREKLDPELRWTDRVYPDGTWEANLFQFYQRVWPKLAGGLPTPFQIKDGVRRDETPAHQSLREAFVNAIIHADYSAPGGVVIERYPDRFKLDNPGTLLVSISQLRTGGVSECRNKALQQMFMMIGGGERAGSGVDKIRSGWKSQHWRSPRIAERQNPERVLWILPMLSLIPPETLEKLRLRFGPDLVASLPGLELQALATVELERHVTNSRMQELVEEHPTDITKRLQILCNRGFLESDNRRRWTAYRFKGQEPSLFDTEELESITPKGQDSPPKGQDSPPKGQDSPPKGQDSPPKGQDSPPKGQGMTPVEEGSKEWEILMTLAVPVTAQKRTPPEVTKAVILSLCQDRFLSLGQLAKLLHRDATTLQSKMLSPMLRDESLTLRFPDSKNRPDQAYTATKKGTQE